MNEEKIFESTFDEFISDPERKENFEKGYKEFILSELIIALMEEDEKSVRILAKESGLSPTVIQELRSGKKTNVTLKNFNNIIKSMGYKLYIKKGRKQIPLEI
jgi:DNA-binding Xre family transcriptional regulator